MRKFAAISLGVLFSGSAAFSQDQCRDLLSNGFFESFTSSDEVESSSAEFYWACSASYEEAKDYVNREQARSTTGSARGAYGVYSGNAAYGDSRSEEFTESYLSRWKSENCTNRTAEQQDRGFSFYAQSTVSTTVVDAWRQCMANSDLLACWASPQGSNILFTVSWNLNHPTGPIVRDAILHSGAQQTRVWQNGMELLLGEKTHVAPREDERDYLFQVNAEHDRFGAYSCFAYVPVPVTFPTPIEPRRSVEFLSLRGQPAAFDCNWSDKRKCWDRNNTRAVVYLPIGIYNPGETSILLDDIVMELVPTPGGQPIVLEADTAVEMPGITEAPAAVSPGTSWMTPRFIEPGENYNWKRILRLVGDGTVSAFNMSVSLNVSGSSTALLKQGCDTQIGGANRGMVQAMIEDEPRNNVLVRLSCG